MISCAINKYIYVTIKKHSKLFSEKYRLNYSETEEINSISKIKNQIIKECIKYSKINDNIYISTIADIPGSSGLGSSSSFCAGLINVLESYRGVKLSKKKLVQLAIFIEVNKLRKPIGIQDHFPPVYGGFNYYKFYKKNKYEIRKIKRKSIFKKNIFNNLLFFWTGVSRSSEDVLYEQKRKNNMNNKYLNDIKNIADSAYQKLQKGKMEINEFGYLLDESWKLKKKLSSKVSNHYIDEAYEIGKKSGANGGKILGAGNGGFLLLSSERKNHEKIIKNMKKLNLRSVNFDICDKGSEIILKN